MTVLNQNDFIVSKYTVLNQYDLIVVLNHNYGIVSMYSCI